MGSAQQSLTPVGLRILDRAYSILPPVTEFQVWNGFALQCPCCGSIWFHTIPGDYLAQQLGFHCFQVKCPNHNPLESLSDIMDLPVSGENPIMALLDRFPRSVLVELLDLIGDTYV